MRLNGRRWSRAIPPALAHLLPREVIVVLPRVDAAPEKIEVKRVEGVVPTFLVIDVQVIEKEHPAPPPFVLVLVLVLDDDGGGGGFGGRARAGAGADGPRLFRRADDGGGGGGRRPPMVLMEGGATMTVDEERE